MVLNKQRDERRYATNFTLILTDKELTELRLTPEQRGALDSWPYLPLWKQMLVLAGIAKLISENGEVEERLRLVPPKQPGPFPLGTPSTVFAPQLPEPEKT